MDKLLNKLNSIYFKMDFWKYILPEEITRNNTKAPTQNLINTFMNNGYLKGSKSTELIKNL